MRRLTCLLVPGLNDKTVFFKPFYLHVARRWRARGVACRVVPMHWSDDVRYEEKLKVLLAAIDKACAQTGEPVVLVGVSAGASIVVPAFYARKNKVKGIVTISGLLSLAPSDEVKAKLFDKAWYGSTKACEALLRDMDERLRRRIVTFSPLWDSTVRPERARIAGADNRRIWSAGHVVSIGVALLAQTSEVIAAMRYIDKLGTTSRE